MNISETLKDKSLKAKEKAQILAAALIEKRITITDIVAFAQTAKDAEKAICIEALEFVTKETPGILDELSFSFVVDSLQANAANVKWESAKVIANTAHLFPEQLETAIHKLLQNTEHPGTVVRWSAALALGEIYKLQTKHNKKLLPAIQAVLSREEKNSIRKIYFGVVKNSE